jgi:bacteriocin biosynthesis cyclodehydratase domain-containing protein
MNSSLPMRPRIKRHLLATTIENDNIIVLAEDNAWLWKSSALALLLPQLTGAYTVSELFELLGARISAPEIVYLLNQLRDLGLLTDGSNIQSPDSCDAERTAWDALGVTDEMASSRIRRSRIRVRESPDSHVGKLLADALTANSMTVTGADDSDMDIVVADHYFRPELTQADINAPAVSSPWMVCKLVGRTIWIGPIFQPGRTGCMACLQDRLRLNRQVEDYVVRKTGDASYHMTSVGSSPAFARLGATWAAQEVALWLAGRIDRLEGRLLSLTFGPNGLEVSTHVLVRRPQCAVCGDPELARKPVPISLGQTRLELPMEPGDRIESTDATLRRLDHHISPITGVVTSLFDLGKDPDGLAHCYGATHSISLGPDSIYWLRHSLRSRTGGKGATESQARASAVCEAIERYCGVFRNDLPRLRSSYAALRDRAVHPDQCLNFSSQQYEHREELNADNQEGYFHLVPRRFPEDLEIDWVPLWSLTQENIRYLPAALCYYGHPDVEQHFYCAADANGCAAGNVLEEAILHAFLEVVERDSAAIWWYNRLTRPEIDLDSTQDPYIARVRARYARQGREVVGDRHHDRSWNPCDRGDFTTHRRINRGSLGRVRCSS